MKCQAIDLTFSPALICSPPLTLCPPHPPCPVPVMFQSIWRSLHNLKDVGVVQVKVIRAEGLMAADVTGRTATKTSKRQGVNLRREFFFFLICLFVCLCHKIIRREYSIILTIMLQLLLTAHSALQSTGKALKNTEVPHSFSFSTSLQAGFTFC